MQRRFFQKRFLFTMYLLFILGGPILTYWRSAWWPDTIDHFSLVVYLEMVGFEFLFFTGLAIIVGAWQRISVDSTGISLMRYGRVITCLAWTDVDKIYRQTDKLGFGVVFENKEKTQRIPIYYSTTKHFRIIYDICGQETLQTQLKDLKLLR